MLGDKFTILVIVLIAIVAAVIIATVVKEVRKQESIKAIPPEMSPSPIIPHPGYPCNDPDCPGIADFWGFCIECGHWVVDDDDIRRAP